MLKYHYTHQLQPFIMDGTVPVVGCQVFSSDACRMELRFEMFPFKQLCRDTLVACKFGQFVTLVYINDAVYSDSVTHKWRDTELYGVA